LSGARIGRELQRLIGTRGKPEQVICDNGPEFTSKALDEWAYRRRWRSTSSAPGKPVENAFIESFNGRFRDECLNMHWFADLLDAGESLRLGGRTTTRSVLTARWTARHHESTQTTSTRTHPTRGLETGGRSRRHRH